MKQNQTYSIVSFKSISRQIYFGQSGLRCPVSMGVCSFIFKSHMRGANLVTTSFGKKVTGVFPPGSADSDLETTSLFCHQSLIP